MKSKLRFILPRLFAATLIIGAVSFVLFILFKLLLAVAAIGGLLFLASKLMGKGRFKDMRGSAARKSAIMPQEYTMQQSAVHPYKASGATIVPIQ